ncbi:MAG TPA: cysteine rich repeat-containing protein [Myxococcota bacterium]|nr:cysteine rich repeat-containing protein [Myxococcota bacterium]
MRARLLTVLTVISGLLLISDFAMARDWGACGADVRNFCKGIRPGQSRLVRCLWQQREQLSGRCKAQARRDWEKAMQISADCTRDARKLCRGIIPGKGRIAACLLSHEAELSPACRPHVARVRETGEKVKKGLDKLILGACKADKDRFCNDVRPGHNRIVDCLSGHRAELRPACRRKLMRVQGRQRQR